MVDMNDNNKNTGGNTGWVLISIAVMAIVAGIVVLMATMFESAVNVDDRIAEAEQMERDAAHYYTARVEALDLNDNIVVLENGTRLDLISGWRQSIMPQIGDVVSYGETIQHYPSPISDTVTVSDTVIYIDMKIIGSTK